ncbi:MAG: hypothetical protein KIT59_09025 [Nitrosomonas sp.]|nr:hypothetical protein [Nitrosomonas sp.]
MQIKVLSQKMEEDTIASWPIRLTVGGIVLMIAVGLLYAIWSLAPDYAELKWTLAASMHESGVSHPVTAVLMNFRGYDTLLEMGVLLLAVIGAWSLTPIKAAPETHPPGLVQDGLLRLLIPLITLVAGYVLWVGAYAPGGAFQAGALLTAAGILLLLSDWQLPASILPWLLRLLLVSGVAVFIGAALSMLWLNTYLLAYPPQWAGSIILLIELCATVTISAILVALFLGGRPDEPDSTV